MLKKLALDQTKEYEKYLVMEEISNMLVSFVKGHPYHLAIGTEQGDVEKWDDLVIQDNNGGYIHIQAKRQTTPFSTDSIIRDTYIKGENKGKPRKLSALDETFQSLGKQVSTNVFGTRIFWLVLPESLIEIKKGLSIRHLRKLRESIKKVTTSYDLINLAKKDADINNIYHWLTTWCDFSDWEHILKAFKVFKLKVSGYEDDINDRVEKNLSDIFKITKIDVVKKLILTYIDENTTFAGAIRPRELLYLLKEYLLPEISRWTLFNTEGSSWDISGINDLEDNSEIERPSFVVPALWSTGNLSARSLKIYGPCVEDCVVADSLLRLSLHPQCLCNVYFSDKASWQNSIKSKIGGTFGLTNNDICDLRMLDGLEPLSPSEFNKFITTDEKEDLAEKLHCEMYRITMKLVNDNLLHKFGKMNRGSLRQDIETRWMAWESSLNNSIEKQKELFSKILHPRAEGKSISGELRVGPKTIDLLVEAIFLLLLISVCLGDVNNQGWESVSDKLKMTSVGLAYWSGPADSTKKVIKIDSDPEIGKLLENEAEQIIIIPQSLLTDLELLEDDITGNTSKLSLLTHPKYPKLLITQDRQFNKLLDSGDILRLKEYFQNRLNNYEQIFNSAIQSIVG